MMTRVILTAVSRVSSPALLFGGGGNAFFMGHVLRDMPHLQELRSICMETIEALFSSFPSQITQNS